MQYSVKIINNSIKIYFNETLHLVISQNNFDGFQAWIGDRKFIIEYYTKSNTVITTEYDTIDKWKTILNLLDAEELFPIF